MPVCADCEDEIEDFATLCRWCAEPLCSACAELHDGLCARCDERTEPQPAGEPSSSG